MQHFWGLLALTIDLLRSVVLCCAAIWRCLVSNSLVFEVLSSSGVPNLCVVEALYESI